MTLLKTIIPALLALFSLTACAQKQNSSDHMIQSNTKERKVLVAYFSATGTTRHVATQIAEAVNGTLLEIEPTEKYTSADLDWHNDQSRSSVEMKDSGARTSIKPDSVNADDYDLILIGYPIWWDLAPTAINTFIESHKLQGKCVALFATSGGSSIDNSATKLEETYPELHWMQPKLLNRPSSQEIRNWFEALQ